jgi:branched-chain amino acid transport system permease protein
MARVVHTQSTPRTGEFARASRWKAHETAIWAVALLALLVFPRQAALWNEIAILALFAVSLDLVLGYAGILTLGHAAFFGTGCYAAALFAKHAMHDPLAGLAVGMAVAAAVGFVASFMVLRGSELTRLMVTLGVASILYELANRFEGITGGADGLQGVVMGPVLGVFAFGLDAKVACAYSLCVLFALFLVARHIAHSPFGYALKAIRDNRTRAAAIGIDVNRAIVTVYTLGAALAGAAGALLAQTTAFASLDVLGFDRSADVMLVLILGGTGYLYGGVIGAVIFRVVQNALSAWTPQYWQFWLGLMLVVIVLIGHERMTRRWRTLVRALRRKDAIVPAEEATTRQDIR